MGMISKVYSKVGKTKPKPKKHRSIPYGCGPVKIYSKSGLVSDGFYQSREWLELRYKVLLRHGARCQCCGRTRRDNIKLHVDHIKPRAHYPALELDIENLQVLCEECNLGKSSKDVTDWR